MPLWVINNNALCVCTANAMVKVVATLCVHTEKATDGKEVEWLPTTVCIIYNYIPVCERS